MKVALYKRVSTNKQTNLNQSVRLVEYAKSKGWDYDEFDEVESSRNSRPIKQHLLSLLRKGNYDAVVVYKLDRWARSSTEVPFSYNSSGGVRVTAPLCALMVRVTGAKMLRLNSAVTVLLASARVTSGLVVDSMSPVQPTKL